MVAGAIAAGVAGEGIKSGASIANTRLTTQAQIKIAEVEARARTRIAETERRKAIITEADEITGLLDRPCIHIRWKEDNTEIELNLSVLSVHGLMAAWDTMGQYGKLEELQPDRVDQAIQNNDIIQGLLGYAPMDLTSIANAANAFTESNPPEEGKASPQSILDQILGKLPKIPKSFRQFL